MRIVVHGQQAFGKAVLEALLGRGDDVVAVYAAPDRPGGKPDPLKEAARAPPGSPCASPSRTATRPCGASSALSPPTSR